MEQVGKSVMFRLCQSLSNVGRNWEMIRSEMKAIPEEELNHPSKNVGLPVDRSKWCHYVLKFRGMWTDKGMNNCPKTYKLLKDVPNLFRVTFITMQPGVHLPPHVGDYKKGTKDADKLWRYHLGLEMDKEDRSHQGMVIEDKVQRWSEGDSFMFNDSLIHSAWNYGKHPRTILCVDLLF